jgi:hypothetical protein
MNDQELLDEALRDDARHLDEILAIGEALGAPDGSTGAEILGIAREAIRRIRAMEFLLHAYLPKCGSCSAPATRSYHHVSGNLCYACDGDECITEYFCTGCHQVSYDTSEPCQFCGSTGYRGSRESARSLLELPFAEVQRRAGVKEG